MIKQEKPLAKVDSEASKAELTEHFYIAYTYRIVENFRGWKRSWILQFESHPRKFSPRNFGCAIPTHDWFSIPRKFSLYLCILVTNPN